MFEVLAAASLGVSQVGAQGLQPPVITEYPEPVAGIVGLSAEFRVVAEGADLNYQWRRTDLGQDLENQTTSVLTISRLAESDFGNYAVRVWNDDGFAESTPVPLSLKWPAPENLNGFVGNTSGLGSFISSMALDGRRMALVNRVGGVAVFELDETAGSWEPATIAYPGSSPQVAISLAGDVLVVGYPLWGRNDLPQPAGVVYIYERNHGGSDNWGESMILEDWNARTTNFGSAVSTDGKTIAVRHSAGVVLYRKKPDSQGRSRWFEEDRFFADNAPSDSSIRVSGDHLAMFGTGSSYLLLYRRMKVEGEMQWPLVRVFSTGYECVATALHGDELAFSWRSASTAAATVQMVRFDRDSLQWGGPQTLDYPGSSQPFSYGASLSLFGHTFAVGADEADNENGRVYLFRRKEGSSVFNCIARLHSDRTDGERFGQRVALADRLLVVLGPEAQPERGVAYSSYLSPDRPAIVRHPSKQTVNTGEELRLEVEAAGPHPMSFRWFRDSQLVDESAEPVFVREAAAPSDAGSYLVEAVGPGGQVQSLAANVVVRSIAPSFAALRFPFTVRRVTLSVSRQNSPAVLRSPSNGSKTMNFFPERRNRLYH